MYCVLIGTLLSPDEVIHHPAGVASLRSRSLGKNCLKTLFKAGAFASAFAQEEQPGTADFLLPVDDNFFNAW